MNDKSDIPELQSITLVLGALAGNYWTDSSNLLIMKGIDEIIILIRSPFSVYIQRRQLALLAYWKSENRKYI